MLRLPKGESRLRGSIARAYKGRCGNCQAELGEQERYCKFCGTERGKDRFEPFSNSMVAVYGPPIMKRYQCSLCKHQWSTLALGGGKDSKYCPQCGERQITMTDRELFEFDKLMDDVE